MIQFFTGETLHSGNIFSERLLVPANEIWVWQQPNKDLYAMWGMEQQNPVATWWPRRATPVYKFRQSVNHTWSILLFQGTAIPINIEIQTRVLLRDPITHVQFGQFQHDHTQILEFTLYKALHGPPTDQAGKTTQGVVQTIAPNFRDLVPPICRRLLPQTDVSHYVRDLPEFAAVGMVPYALAQVIHRSPAYQRILQRAETELSDEFRLVRIHLQEEAANIENKKAILDLHGHYYASQLGFYDLLFPQIQPTLETIIRDVQSGSQQPVPPALSATIFNDLLCQEIARISQADNATFTTNIGSQPTAQTAAIQQRTVQIEAVYTEGNRMNWNLSPPQEDCIEHIIVRFGNDSDMILSVPRAYPQIQALVPVIHRNGVRLPFHEVNTIISPILQRRSYNLLDLVQSVANAL